MILVLLYLLLGTGQFSIHNAGNAFVAAYEDLGTSIPGSSDVSLFATDPIPDLNDQEEPTPLLDSTLSAGDQQDIFNEIPISPLSDSIDVPYTSAFNIYPPPEGFNPCPNGLKYACCLDVSRYLPYKLDCIWYDYDIVSSNVKKVMCQDAYIFCCGDIKNGGIKEDGGPPGNEGMDCEGATRSEFKEALPTQQDQPDWVDTFLKIFLTPNPLFRIPAPVAAPEGS